jgi:hypothetical protein
MNNINFLLPCRFDLIAKYIYIKFRETNIPFYQELYKAHITTFNNCWEYPGTKSCIDDFYNSFNKLIENMKNNGFNKEYPITIGNNGVIINGAHRLMICFYYNINPIFENINENGNIDYNYDYFINRKEKPPLDRLYADYMALEYTKIHPQVRAMVLYPTATKYNKFINIVDIINKYGFIYYHKDINLNKNGINNLIKEMYRNEEWIGGLFPNGWSPGGKAERCIENSKTTIILIVMNNLNECVELKEKCRELYGLGKHSLHISDEMEDTFRITSCLLNNNSVHFLNNGTNDVSHNTKSLLDKYFRNVKNKDEFCLTSSLLLEMYGLRNAKDIDYININDTNLNIENIGCHDGQWFSYYQNNKNELLFNPKNYFYFNGYKFLTLENIYKMKLNRNENKDIKDIKLIEKIGIV